MNLKTGQLNYPNWGIERKEWGKTEHNVRGMWDNIKLSNIHITGVTYRDEGENGKE